MSKYINLLFENNRYGTVLVFIEKEEEQMGCITTKASYTSLTLSGSAIMRYFDQTKKKQIKAFDNLLKSYAPMGRAFLTDYTYFERKKEEGFLRISLIKNLKEGEEYYSSEFDYFMAKEKYTSALTYKGIFPGTLGNFYDLYKEDMFEDALKVNGIKEEEEKKLRLTFKTMLERGEI